ncbi:hypothetical protein [Paraburkholderia caffeinilytica]|uniref:hypothetical protein n=1 Tax=Paraburkholderia caffeinilytica TaxID=1761016 RepID=UPI003DA0F076
MLATVILPYKLLVLAAGAVGAVVPAALQKSMSRRERLIMVFVGCAAATFIAPAINAHWLPDADVRLGAGVSFCVGLFGMTLVEMALRLVRRRGQWFLDRAVDRVIGRSD